MKSYQVSWSHRAEIDLEEIMEYIAIHDVDMAMQLLDKIQFKAESLHKYPNRGRILPELKDQGITHYRELIITPWRLIYRVSKSEVMVITLIDSRQNVEDILLNRL